jgi:tRNA 5-methylaminomethyl-2-thiouridine biosynthesis bifunctional protein
MSVPHQDAPVLDWQDGQPISRIFADVYFSRASGIEETRHVFLYSNHLPERFAALTQDAHFVIGETGFGTGLNFLCAWQLFEQVAPPGARLHFVSTELYPLSGDELRDALGLWPALEDYSRALLSQCGPLAPGWHRFVFAQGRVILTLIVGDARQTLAQLDAQVDAWFLDGFSPAKNPQLWEAGVLRAIAEHSRPGATFGTYTAAGAVRRGLDEVGFRVEKVRGYGPKRDMLRGEYAGTASLRAPRVRYLRSAVVIGGGLAGTAAARSLAMRGWRVTLLERHDALAAEASGNPQGVLYARLSPAATPLSQLVLAGYQYTLRVLRALLPCDGEAWSDAPILQLAHDEQETRRQSRLLELGLPAGLVRAADQEDASRLAGIDLPSGGLLFAGGGWVHPPALCRAQVAHPGITVMLHRHALGLERDPAADTWRVVAGKACLAEAPVLVVAGAAQTLAFEQLAHLPLRTVRGQVTSLPETSASRALRAVLCSESYVAPARAGLHTAGATFTHDDQVDPTAADNAQNLAALAELAPGLYAALDGAALDAASLVGRAAFRCVSPDYLPVVGAASDRAGEALPALFLSTAHGSRGLITAPLAGEMLAALVDAGPAPVSRALMDAMAPGRFATRRVGSPAR